MSKEWIELVSEYQSIKEIPEGSYAGLDEVGVSSIAGSMVCSIVILPKEHGITRLPIDSKLLQEESITDLALDIQKKAYYYAIFSINPQDVDDKVNEIDMLSLHKQMWSKLLIQ